MGGNTPVSYVDADKALTPLSFQSMPFDFYSGGDSFLIVGDGTSLNRLNSYSLDNIGKRLESIQATKYATITIKPKIKDFELDKYSGSVVKSTGKVTVKVINILPSTIMNKSFTWKVANDNFATVVPVADTLTAEISAKGIIGSTVVTVTSVADPTIKQFFTLNITDTLQGIVMNKSATEMIVGGNDTLSVTFIPPSEPVRHINWSLKAGSATGVVTLLPNTANSTICNLRAEAVGTVTVVASDDTNTYSAECIIVVRPTVTSITLNFTTLKTDINTVLYLNASTLPVTAVNRDVTWSIDNTNVAFLAANGNTVKITSKDINGMAVITATSVDNPLITATCQLSVLKGQSSTSGSTSRMDDEPQEKLEPVTPIEDDPDNESIIQGIVSLDQIDTSLGMQVGVPFYDYTNVNDVDGLSAQYDIPSVMAPPIATTFDLSITDLTVTTQDTFTITATFVPANLPDYDDVLVRWKVDKADYLIRQDSKKNSMTLLAKKSTPVDEVVTISCELIYLSGYNYVASPDHTWYHSVISNCCVATTYAEIPQVKQFGERFFQDLPGWGEQTVVDGDGNPAIVKYNWKCDRVRAFNNRLFALNMRETNDSGVTTHYPLRIRWSNFANENAAPSLWDDYAYNRLTTSDQLAGQIGQVEALENGYAGYIDLADSNGDLLDMLPLKDYLFVYTEFETYVGTPTMNSYQPLMFKKLFNDSGILAPECVCEVEGGHFVVTQNDIILHNGTSKKSLAYQRVKDKIIREISAVNPLATKVHLHDDRKEVWICYVNAGSVSGSWACNKAAIWNYEFDTWSFCDIPSSYDIGLADPPVLEKGALWSDMQGTTYIQALQQKLQWQKNVTNFHKRITLIGSAMKGFFQVDVGNYNHIPIDIGDLSQGAKELPLIMKVERTGIDFDNATNEWNQKHINKFHPQVTGRGTFTFEAGGSQYSNEYGHKHSTKDYILGKDRHVAVRLNHPYLYYNIIDKGTYGNDPKTGLPIFNDCAINGLTIEYEIGGRR